MNFKEYFENELLEDCFIEDIIEEGVLGTIGSVASAPLKFAAGAATNLGSQIGRGAYRATRGAARAGIKGTGKMGLAALKAATFDVPGALKTAWSGVKDVASGVGDVVAGATQVAASPVSALARGAQATTEPLTPQEFDPNRNAMQKFLGVNTWGNQQKTQQSSNTSEFNKLLAAHRAASSRDEKKQIEKQIKAADPVRYAALIKRGEAKLAAMRAKAAVADARNAIASSRSSPPPLPA